MLGHVNTTKYRNRIDYSACEMKGDLGCSEVLNDEYG